MDLINFLFSGVGVTVVLVGGGWLIQRYRRGPDPVAFAYHQPPLQEVKRLSRILLVDDKEFEYLDLLAKDGYSIEKWADVESIDVIVKGDYAVVLLDLYGIGKSFSTKDHGLAVLSALRTRSPAQVIGIYSASKWEIGQQQQYFDLADAVIDKARLSYPAFTKEVDELLMRSVDVTRYIDAIASCLEISFSSSQVSAVRKILESSPPHDIDARITQIGQVVPAANGLSGGRLNNLHSVVEFASQRMKPWIRST